MPILLSTTSTVPYLLRILSGFFRDIFTCISVDALGAGRHRVHAGPVRGQAGRGGRGAEAGKPQVQEEVAPLFSSALSHRRPHPRMHQRPNLRTDPMSKYITCPLTVVTDTSLPVRNSLYSFILVPLPAAALVLQKHVYYCCINDKWY